jgi:hypothetical protein
VILQQQIPTKSGHQLAPLGFQGYFSDVRFIFQSTVLSIALLCGVFACANVQAGLVMVIPLQQGAVAHSTVVANGKTQEEALAKATSLMQQRYGNKNPKIKSTKYSKNRSTFTCTLEVQYDA